MSEADRETGPGILLVPTPIEIAAIFGSAVAEEARQGRGAYRGVPLRCSGMGVVEAAARTAFLLREIRSPAESGAAPPSSGEVWLLGCAGALDPDLRAGDLLLGEACVIAGLGLGKGERGMEAFLSPGAGGGDRDLGPAPPVRQELLVPPRGLEGAAGSAAIESGVLLTVCACSEDAAQAEDRRRAFPEALSEDMETWAVARAACLAGFRTFCLRAVSNRCGDRDRENWNMEAAGRALREGLDRMLDSLDAEENG